MTATLMTVDEMREHVETALSDDALQRLMDAAEDDINDHAGRLTMEDYDTAEEVTEWVRGGSRQSSIRVKMPIESITSVTSVYSGNPDDTEDDLVEDEDYWFDGASIIRKGYFWGDRVRVVYVPKNTLSQRRACMILLVRLAINSEPGVGFEGAATWQSTSQDYEQSKQRILWSLYRPPAFA